MNSVQVRLMREEDLPAAEQTSAVTFFEAERGTRRVSDPEPEPRSVIASKQWIDRMRHFLSVDPGGCWIAVEERPAREKSAGEAQVIGFAISQNRDDLWFLATYGVLPGHQGRGIGRQLIDAALAHAAGRPGVFVSSVHPGATRRYRLAGFSLHPLMQLTGTVDRSTLPAVGGLRDGRADDVEWMDRLDRDLRGAGHGPDHAHMLTTLRLVVTEDRRKPGYVYVDGQGRASLLAAAHPETARSLLWEALASARGRTLVNCVTTPNQWAVDVGLAARLDIGQEGYLAVRGLSVPAPYLASGHFL